MARMSIDDMVGRDPRITMLAQTLGWSRREVVGCLVSDVWPIVYDQRTELISERVIDAAAGHVGFAAALIECELATRDRSGKVVIKGARERIKYLDHKTEAGRQGGLKSAESRHKNSSKRQASGEADVKHGGSTGQAAGNPPSPVPDSAPDPVPAPAQEVREPAPAGALQSLKAKVDKAARLPSKGPLPSDWTPSGACRDRARDLRLDLSHESEQFSASARAHGRRYADWDAAFRTWLGNAAKWRDERGGPRFSAQSEIRTNLQPL